MPTRTEQLSDQSTPKKHLTHARGGKNLALALLSAMGLASAAHAQIDVGPVVDPSTGDRYYRTASLPLGAIWSWADYLRGNTANLENSSQAAWVLNNVIRAGGNTQSTYVGLGDWMSEGQLLWENGDELTFTSWAPGQPNNTAANDFTVVDPATGNWTLVSSAQWAPGVIRVSGPIHVPREYPTIQAAINAAVEGQTIEVDMGFYSEKIDFNGKRLVVRSIRGAEFTTIVSVGQGLGVNINSINSEGAGLHGFTITQSGENTDWLVVARNKSVVSGCRISNPTGGGVLLSQEAVLSDSLLVGNNVAVMGESGATPGRTTVQNCTVVGNTIGVVATSYGQPSTVLFLNSVTRSNTVPFTSNPGGALVYRSNVIAEGAVGGPNLNATPQFVGAPGANGTFELTDDYRLAAGSPGIDAGHNGLRKIVPATAQNFDLGGTPRYLDTPEVQDTGAGPGPMCDTGAYEHVYVAPEYCPGDFDRDGFVDFFDFDAFVQAFEEGC